MIVSRDERIPCRTRINFASRLPAGGLWLNCRIGITV
jgi:hypothetical protein